MYHCITSFNSLFLVKFIALSFSVMSLILSSTIISALSRRLSFALGTVHVACMKRGLARYVNGMVPTTTGATFFSRMLPSNISDYLLGQFLICVGNYHSIFPILVGPLSIYLVINRFDVKCS